MKSFIKYFLFAVCFSGCAKSGEVLTSQPTPDSLQGNFTLYTIKAGEHYSNGTLSQASGKTLTFETIFDSSCIYETRSKQNEDDINKLYGFSDCNTLHHENSARVGWLWKDEAIKLYAYCYINKERKSQFLGTANIGDTIKLSIGVSAQEYTFTYKDITTTIGRYCNDPEINGYVLYPYFGGDETAPHDIHIRIR